jgi:hypothetical protein
MPEGVLSVARLLPEKEARLLWKRFFSFNALDLADL